MREIIINDDNLSDLDIDSVVIRVKGIILNSYNKLLLVFNNDTYQLPGGHLKNNETINECLSREIREEIGIDIDVDSIEPFLCIKTYDKDYNNTGKKVLNMIYYFKIDNDEEPNIDNTNYDELELLSEFELYYVNFSNIRSFFSKAFNDNKIEESIYREIDTAIDIYNDVYGGNL